MATGWGDRGSSAPGIPTDRRGFLSMAAMAGAALAVPAAATPSPPSRTKLHAFSKNFMFLSREELCEALAEAGLDGVEWCVRGRSHVDPLKARSELPLAVKAARSRGLLATMVCTRSKGDGTDAPEEGDIVETLKVCADNGITLWRPGGFVYDEGKTVAANLEAFRVKFARLEEISRQTGVRCAYQNHFGCFGGGVHDMLDIVRGLDSRHFSLQYDVMHAVFETPVSWERYLREAAPFVSSACLKDCNALADQKDDMWKTFKTVPAPTGVVPFERYARLLLRLGVDVPHSVHYEIDLPKGDRRALVAVLAGECGYFRRTFAAAANGGPIML